MLPCFSRAMKSTHDDAEAMESRHWMTGYNLERLSTDNQHGFSREQVAPTRSAEYPNLVFALLGPIDGEQPRPGLETVNRIGRAIGPDAVFYDGNPADIGFDFGPIEEEARVQAFYPEGADLDAFHENLRNAYRSIDPSAEVSSDIESRVLGTFIGPSVGGRIADATKRADGVHAPVLVAGDRYVVDPRHNSKLHAQMADSGVEEYWVVDPHATR